MGVRIKKTVSSLKQSTTASTHTSANIPSIGVKEVGLVALVGEGRDLEVINKWKELQEFIKNNDLLTGAGSASALYVAVDIDGDKRDIEVLPLVADYVTDMVGIQVHGTLRGYNGCVPVEFDSAITELVEWAIENKKVDL